MLNQPILLADVLGTIISVLVLLFWVVSQVLSARQAAKNEVKPEVKPRRQPQDGLAQEQPQWGQPQQAPRQQPRNQEDSLRSEVEAYLRRAQGQPEQQRQMPAPKDQPPRGRPQRFQEQGFQEQDFQDQGSEEQRPEPARLAAPTPTLRSEGVAEHVARHMSTQGIADHAEMLGDKVALADEKLESRLRDKFDHKLGQLERQEIPGKKQVAEVDVAAEVAAMLRSPQGMRQLIIANEILRRPEW